MESLGLEATITYTYDSLYRLTGADYSDGSYFRYAYDACFAEGKSGNRLSEETEAITNTYAYTSNKLSSIISGSGSIDFTWDDNGNLLDDGSYTYSYDHANRLKIVNGPEVSASYAYNGLGVRVQETVGGTTTHYVVDLNTGLTQVLSDGTNTYLFGIGRIAQESTSGKQYFLEDALGSVRQLVDSNGSVQLVKSYEPYGEVLNSAGDGATDYGFTGEWTDSYIKFVNLRSRMYDPRTGRFTTKDKWRGDYTKPMSLNAWLYVYANPVNKVDPSGFITEDEAKGIGVAQGADKILEDLKNMYGVVIEKDYGWGWDNSHGYGLCGKKWYPGSWKSIKELELVEQAMKKIEGEMGSANKFKSAMNGDVTIYRWGITAAPILTIDPILMKPIIIIGSIRPFAPPIGPDIVLPDYIFSSTEEYAKYEVAHELGHVWDRRTSLRLSNELMLYMGTLVCQGMGGCYFDIRAGKESPPGDPNLDEVYAGESPMEDWAEAFASTIYKTFYPTYWGPTYRTIGSLREKYVRDQIAALP